MNTFDLKQKEFNEWDKKNPKVWMLFKKFSLEAIDKGHKRLSHWLIINRIRWETFVSTTGDDYKISNDFIAFYARKWKLEFPQYAELYKTKRMKDEPIS